MPLYSVFLVFVNGHCIKVGETVYEENARHVADYHHAYVAPTGCWLEVTQAGRRVYSTNPVHNF